MSGAMSKVFFFSPLTTISHPHLDLNEEVPQVFFELRYIVIQMKQSVHKYFQLSTTGV